MLLATLENSLLRMLLASYFGQLKRFSYYYLFLLCSYFIVMFIVFIITKYIALAMPCI